MKQYLEYLGRMPKNNQEKQIIEHGYEANALLFGGKRVRVPIYICDSSNDFKRLSGRYYFPFSMACVQLDGRVVAKSPELLKISLSRWGRIISHEINHSFWIQRFGTWKPFWISEGLACHVAQNRFLLSKAQVKRYMVKEDLSHECLYYTYLARRLRSRQELITLYSIWTRFLEHIIQNDPGSLLSFLKSYSRLPTRARYFSCFERQFGDVQTLFENFSR